MKNCLTVKYKKKTFCMENRLAVKNCLTVKNYATEKNCLNVKNTSLFLVVFVFGDKFS